MSRYALRDAFCYVEGMVLRSCHNAMLPPGSHASFEIQGLGHGMFHVPSICFRVREGGMFVFLGGSVQLIGWIMCGC